MNIEKIPLKEENQKFYTNKSINEKDDIFFWFYDTNIKNILIHN